MSGALDSLIDFLIDQIAFRGDKGMFDYRRVVRFSSNPYNSHFANDLFRQELPSQISRNLSRDFTMTQKIKVVVSLGLDRQQRTTMRARTSH